jgi:ATP-dependent Lhr-like helicase
MHALLDAVRRGELNRLSVPSKPLHVLAQQIVAEVAACDYSEQALFELVTRAYPYAALTREEYDEIIRMLADGFSTARGQRAAYLHRDAVNHMLRGRRGAKLTSITSGGAIPDTADYNVVLEPAGQLIGTLNEDFAIETLAGDIFQLGNASYRVLRVEAGRMRVEDAQGQPPTIPFWLGEAPGRSNELSYAVSRLCEEITPHINSGTALEWVDQQIGISAPAGEQLVEYRRGAFRSGFCPGATAVERFDEWAACS